MKIAGIIAEYNPFHRGHAYHIRRTREITGCDYVVVCMDGHFTQRGTPACMSKWMRAKMALACGADAVVELPALYAVRTADVFARSGVDILGRLGVDVLSFGSESDDMDLLARLAELREDEPGEVSERIRRNLDAGMSHARARGLAVGEYLGVDPELLNRPNLILATEYIRAIHSDHPRMQPVAVPRIGGYHDDALGEFASASAIRAAYARGEGEAALACLPDEARPFAAFDSMHPMDDLLMYKLRGMSLEEISALPDVREGLDSRLYRLCRETGTAGQLLEALKCKRYTHVRLSRLLAHAVLDMPQALVDAHPRPEYARVIAMREEAGPLMKVLAQRSEIPVAASPQPIREHPCFQLECRATDLWALLHNTPDQRLPGLEFTTKFPKVGSTDCQ